MDPLEMLKIDLGFTNPPDVINKKLNLLVESTKKWLEDEKGINLDLTNPIIVEFIVHYSKWKYEAKGEKGPMPRHLQFELHNLYIHYRRSDVIV